MVSHAQRRRGFAVIRGGDAAPAAVEAQQTRRLPEWFRDGWAGIRNAAVRLASDQALHKTLTWRVTASTDTALIGWVVTGEPLAGLSIAGIEIFNKMILYYAHEKAWSLRTGLGAMRTKMKALTQALRTLSKTDLEKLSKSKDDHRILIELHREIARVAAEAGIDLDGETEGSTRPGRARMLPRP